MRLDLYHHFEEDGEILRIAKLLLANQEKMMATLEQILEDVKAEKGLIASLSTLLTNLKDQLDQALSGVALPEGVQAKIDEIFSDAEENKAALAQALTTSPTTPAGSGPPA